MNEKTYTRRYNKLYNDISIHPHRDELLELMYQQIQDDDAVSVKPSKL